MSASEFFREQRCGIAWSLCVPKTMLMGALVLAKFSEMDLPAMQLMTVQGDRVNVRTRPSLAGEVLMQVNAGTVLSVVEDIGAANSASGAPASWARIKLPSTAHVWVHAAHVQEQSVTANRLNLRGGPSESYSILGQLKRGDKVNVLGQKGDWLEIEAPTEAEAYVAANYLSAASPVKVAALAPQSQPLPSRAILPPPPPPAPSISAIKAPEAVSEPPFQLEPTPPSADKEAGELQAAAALEPKPTIADAPRDFNNEPLAVSPEAVEAPANLTAPPPDTPSPLLGQQASKAISPKAAADEADSGRHLHLWVRPPEPKNEISIGYRVGLNISASFKNAGTFLLPPGQAGVYRDGFVLPSSRGNTDNFTWNWGYQNQSQYDEANDQLIMSRVGAVQSQFDSSGSSKNQLQHGVEATYHRVLFQEENGPLRFGVAGAVNYMPFDFQQRSSGFGDVRADRFAYALAGVRPPDAPYAGTFAGPGPLIEDNPQTLTPVTVFNGARIDSERSFDADVYGLRLGPRVSGEIAPRLLGMVDMGLAVVMVDGRVSYRDRIQGVGSSPVVLSGADDKFNVLPGWYIGAGLLYNVFERVGLFYQIQYQSSSSFNEGVDDRDVRFNLDNGLFQAVGITYTF